MDVSFSELGFRDVGVASEAFRLLKVGDAELMNPKELSKIREIAEFFNDVPEADFALSRLVRKANNPNLKPLDHIWSYVALQKNKRSIEDKLKSLNHELSFYE